MSDHMVNVPAIVKPAEDLDQLAHAIRADLDMADAAGQQIAKTTKRQATHFRDAGRRFKKAKAILGRGNYLPWLEQEGFDRFRAAECIRIDDNWEKIEEWLDQMCETRTFTHGGLLALLKDIRHTEAGVEEGQGEESSEHVESEGEGQTDDTPAKPEAKPAPLSEADWAERDQLVQAVRDDLDSEEKRLALAAWLETKHQPGATGLGMEGVWVQRDSDEEKRKSISWCVLLFPDRRPSSGVFELWSGPSSERAACAECGKISEAKDGFAACYYVPPHGWFCRKCYDKHTAPQSQQQQSHRAPQSPTQTTPLPPEPPPPPPKPLMPAGYSKTLDQLIAVTAQLEKIKKLATTRKVDFRVGQTACRAFTTADELRSAWKKMPKPEPAKKTKKPK